MMLMMTPLRRAVMTDADTTDFSPEQRRYLEGLVAGMPL